MRSLSFLRSQGAPLLVERLGSQLDPYVAPHNLNGPRMRLGVLWFFAVLLGVAGGAFYVSILFGLVAAVAALQASKSWMSAGAGVSNLVAGVGALVMSLASWVGVRPLGLVIVLFAVASLLVGPDMKLDTSIMDPKGRPDAFARAACTLRSGLFAGMAAASVVQIYRSDVMFYVFLLSVACVYDAGDFMCGAGYDNRLVGPVAGAVGIAMVTVSMSFISPEPLDGGAAWVMGCAMLVFVPAGQLLASWVLPRARSFAPGLRRLDSWLVSAPMFLVGLWIVGG